jgi:exopolysaccharide production protein ExoQ
MLVLSTGVLYMAFVPEPAGDSFVKAGESPVYSTIWITGYSILALLVGLHLREFVGVLARHWPAAVLLLAYLLPEIIESSDWRRLALLFCTVAFSAWTAARLSLAQVIEALNYAFCIVLIVHVLNALVDTGYEADSMDRESLLGTIIYAGLFPHKQQVGIVFGTSFVFYTLLCVASGAWSKLLPIVSASLLFLLLSGSASALLVTLAALGASISLLAYTKRQRFLFFTTTLASVVLMGVLLVDSSPLFELVGRSADLTGRKTIWEYWPELFFNRPLTGYGYSGFGAEGGPAEALSSTFGAAHFHNSFLDVGIQAGAPGLFLLMLIVLLGLVGAGASACRSRSTDVVVLFAIFLNVCLIGLVEGSMVSHNSFTTMCLFTIYLKIGTELRLQSADRLAETVLGRAFTNYRRSLARRAMPDRADTDSTIRTRLTNFE